MDSNLLKVFVAVAQKNSFSLGAKKLKVTQTNVSLRIKQLEKNLGFEVFHRIPKGVILTKEGEKLLPLAIEIVDKVKEAQNQIRNIKKQDSLVIASTYSNTKMRLIPLLQKLNQDHPDIRLELITNNTIAIKQMIVEYKVDIAFINNEPSHEDIVLLKRYENELLFVESKKNKTCNTILGHQDICAFFNGAKKYYEHLGIEDYPVLELANFEVILACVELGMGSTILPKSIVKKYGYISKVKSTVVSKDIVDIPTCLVCRKDNLPKISNYLKKISLDI
ncbi:LysR family transcriptional regulator [Poseidonibacter lekithochrous]|uniref:LysR family transcriptional regulator n=1 Tax=Poseidonibacter lekithochrous TaxID=1904463 RepID=UPI0008FCCDD2|nr:LysR family transcriptional regulator [Poseidonibacter lekithochrous]QKJ23235.1 transcriptional regulator, LysR family [Poseidonibacter lekithochrous]